MDILYSTFLWVKSKCFTRFSLLVCLQLCLSIMPAFGTRECYKNPFTTGCSVTATLPCTNSWNPLSVFSEGLLPQLGKWRQSICFRTFWEWGMSTKDWENWCLYKKKKLKSMCGVSNFFFFSCRKSFYHLLAEGAICPWLAGHPPVRKQQGNQSHSQEWCGTRARKQEKHELKVYQWFYWL